MVVGGIAAVQIDHVSAADETGAWRVLEAGGSVRHRPPGDGLWWQAATGDVIAPESEVVTDRGGSLVIGRAAEGIELGPHGRLMLPAVYGLNRVWQDGGRVLYRTSPGRRLEVETPYASLSVRGAIFEATLEPGLLLVEVEGGVVRLTTRDGRAGVELRTGQAARVRAGELTLEVRLAPGEAFQPVWPPPPATVAAAGGSRFAGAGGAGELHPPERPPAHAAPVSGPGDDGGGRSDDPAPGGNGASGRDGGASDRSEPGFAGDPDRSAGASDDDRNDTGRSESGGAGGGQHAEGAKGDRVGNGDRGSRDGHGKGAGGKGSGGKEGDGKDSGGKGGSGKGGGGKGKR